jgi:hypothetical protein
VEGGRAGVLFGVLFELSDTEQGREIYLSFILNKGYRKAQAGEVRRSSRDKGEGGRS